MGGVLLRRVVAAVDLSARSLPTLKRALQRARFVRRTDADLAVVGRRQCRTARS